MDEIPEEQNFFLGEWLTLPEVCQRFNPNIKPKSLRQALNRGSLKGVKRAGRWFVHINEIVKYLNNRRVGRPKKKSGNSSLDKL
jgi:hypothetical protein